MKHAQIYEPGDTVWIMSKAGVVRSALVDDDGNLTTTDPWTPEKAAADPETPGVVVRTPLYVSDAQRVAHAVVARTLAGLPNHIVRITENEVDQYGSMEIKVMKFGDNGHVYVRLVTES
jgi:hypothetical protein